MAHGRFTPVKPGDTYGKWTVLSFDHVHKGGHAYFFCRCWCGKVKSVQVSRIRSGRSKDCGCDRNIVASIKLKTHGLSKHRLFPTWGAMIRRTSLTTDPAYPNYGGRGITVCNRWQDVALFIADMTPSWAHGLTIERRDNDGPYSPENCYWGSRTEQALNRRSNVHLEFDGRTQTLTEWAREIGMAPRTLWARINSGWSIERALTTPLSH